MTTLTKDCRKTREALPELLFDQAAVPSAVQAHVDSCADCRKELESLLGTVALLDDWHAPEPSVYFNARMTARLREEQQRGPQTLAARVRSWFVLTNLHMKPIAGGALALVLAIGGGTYFETAHTAAPSPQASATVRDLQSLDENAQVFQQMNSLDQQDKVDQQDNDDSGSGSNL
jgi:predicted anti-sigma-YlaC factor YlaD